MSGDRPRRRSRGRTGTLYCTDCGEPLEPSMNYCPSCGVANGRRTGRSRSASRSSPSARPRTDASRDESGSADRDAAGTTDRDRLEYRIAAAARDGWQLEHDFGDHAVMIRRTFGGVADHLLVALITVWWTMGVGNVLYGAYRYFDGAERMVVRADHLESDEPTDVTAGSKLLRRATAAVCWLIAAITAAIGVRLGLSTGGLALFALAFLFVVIGISALPSVSRRLETRHSVLTNGRTRSVDERIVNAPEKPCAACTDPVDRGLERTYRSAFCVLGVPVTASEGRNYYCRQCANGEVSRTDVTDRTAAAEPDREPETDRT